ncbi:PAS domain-containing sensor histidine kinase [Candidatus Liberibacter americanus]|uniref:histidine kinase n=1 Tax=Candidatus Liberibacter americanus str. Sao Paulo TaxID=1261131 RepID=U6B2Y5_9HYPH|nr:PAS domain S-box protein [Candidatus Liberibacter americanus]AHA27424.1 Signal transduction histidine kinase [Candidatus Liberibacter americanus str. Sao Paulo]EMS36697.1 PAS/PAC sensor signal transduction histidine kinase [Candidatus Liberibacter americanus PW_SP]
MSIDYINSKTKNISDKNCTDTKNNTSEIDIKSKSITTDFNVENAINKESLKELPIIDSKKKIEIDMHTSGEKSESKNEFLFDPKHSTVRFTWKINAEGYIVDISKEFPQTIGQYTHKVVGMRFCDINNLLRIDPNNYLYEILKQQNTWYGKTTFWPIEGTKLHVPIDLSALPMYSQNHEFKGFKGLGIINISQAKNDPHQFGTKLDSIFSESHNKTEDKSAIKKYEHPIASSKKVPLCSKPTIHTIKEQRYIENNTDLEFSKHTISFPENLDVKNKMEFIYKHYLTKRDILKSAKQLSYSVDEPSFTVNNDSIHTINLNTYVESIKPQINTIDDEYEKAFHYRHYSLSTYFGENKNLTPEHADKYHIPLLVHSNGNLLYANPSFLLLTGYKNIEEIEKSGGIDNLLNAQKLPNSKRTLGSISLYHIDGTSITVTSRLHSIRWNGEKSLAITFVHIDRNNKIYRPIDSSRIDNGKKEKCNLSNTEIEAMQLFSILELASDGVAIINGDGKIISANQAISKLFGYSSKDLLEQKISNFFVREYQNTTNSYISEILKLKAGDKIEKTTIGRTKKGELVSLRITITKLPFSIYYCMIIHDISEWKQEKKKLYDAKKTAEKENSYKSDFLARISHEIRTPLTAIIGFAEIIKNQKLGPVGSNRYIEYADYINKSGNLVLDIVNDLLDISKIEAGQMDFHFESVSLNETISEAISLINLYANEKRILIRTSFSSEIPRIFADMRSIKQIALNILSNAINFTPSGGQIIISTAYIRNKGVILRIKDTGIGMNSYELEKAMQPFRQIINPTRVRKEGTGLGLPLTKAMVDANMGKFSIFSTPSKGTFIEIIFPVNTHNKVL